MENANRLHPQSGHTGHLALEELRRLSREVFLDLGVTEDEIKTYFGDDPEMLDALAGKSAGKGNGRYS